MNTPQRRLPEPVKSTNPNESGFVTMPQSAVVVSGMPNQRGNAQGIDRVGEILRRRREERGDNMQFIADNLYIRRVYLEALENSQYDALPADAYVIGFLRSYSTYLGLDSRDVISLYRAEMAGRRKKPSLSMPTPVTEGRTPSVIVMVAAAVVALLIYALWYGISSSDRASVTRAPALPTVASTAETTSAPTSAADSPKANMTAMPLATAPIGSTGATAAPKANDGKTADTVVTPPLPASATNANTPAIIPPAGFAIRVEESAWVQLKDREGGTVYDHVMKPGEIYAVPDYDDLLLTTGNAPAIIISEDGVDLPRFSATKTTRVLRNIPFDTAHLKAKARGRGDN